MDAILAHETITTLEEYIPKLINGINSAVDEFRAQKEDKALNLMVSIIEGLQWMIQVISKTEYIFAGSGFNIDENRINALFAGLCDAMENQDYVLVTDILEYEVIEFLDEWQDNIKAYINEI